ncbi:MAG TPA: hypothetical protein VFZ73_05045, partial [Gemmatimonadaceae bacterium]
GSAATAQRAAQAVTSACEDLKAQFILVSKEDDPALARSIESTGVEFVTAPRGSSRAEMCDCGMRRASGSIVAVRDDVAIGDATWIDAYRSLIPRRPAVTTSAVESVVMDTQVATRSAPADALPGAAFGQAPDGAAAGIAAAI